MDIWTHGRTDWHTDGTVGWKDRQMHLWMQRWMDGWMDESDKRIDGVDRVFSIDTQYYILFPTIYPSDLSNSATLLLFCLFRAFASSNLLILSTG